MIDYVFFEKLLKERLNTLKERIEHKNSSIKHIQDTHHKDSGDIVGASLQGSVEMGLIDLHNDEVKDIKNALKKLKDGIFGICEMCDDEIDVARLKSKPHAKYCINCRELFEKAQKQKA